MIRNLFMKKSNNVEEVYIIWNESIFEGRTRAEVLKFKERYRKLALKRYKAMQKIASIDAKAMKAMNEIANGKDSQAKLAKTLPIVIGGVLVATVVAANSKAEATKAANAVSDNVSTQSIAVVDVIETVSENNIMVNPIAVNEDSATSSYIESSYLQTESMHVVLDDTDVHTEYVHTEDVYTEEVDTEDVYAEDVYAEDVYSEDVYVADEFTSAYEVVECDKDIIVASNNFNDNISIENNQFIFNQVMELGTNRCAGIFSGLGAVKEISVLDVIERSSNDPIVKAWFEMLLDTNVNHEVVKYSVSYYLPQGAVSFSSRDGEFFAEIDTSLVEARIALDMQHLIDASVKAGVNEKTREMLVSTFYDQVQVYNVLNQIKREFKKQVIDSGLFLQDVKNTVESELTSSTKWDVTAVFK